MTARKAGVRHFLYVHGTGDHAVRTPDRLTRATYRRPPPRAGARR